MLLPLARWGKLYLQVLHDGGAGYVAACCPIRIVKTGNAVFAGMAGASADHVPQWLPRAGKAAVATGI